MSSYQQRYDNAMRLINAAGLAANSEAFKAAKRLSEELAELAQTAEAGDGATMLAIGPKLVELESLAMQYGVAPASASTGGTPVPASAAPTPPTTPTAPPSGTSKWAPPQATPPAAPAPAPSPAPDWERFIGDLRKTIDPVVEAMPRNQDGQIIPAASQAQVNWLSARTAVLEADMKQMEHTPRKGSDFNFKVAGIAAAIVFTVIVVALVIMAQS